MSSFDPYYKWLAIPPEEQPPTHYRLLGLNELESDQDVIAAAADRQMTYIKSLGAGNHAKDAQRVLNELSKARGCLLNPQRKSAYDTGLKRAAHVASEEPEVAPTPLVAEPNQIPLVASPRRRARPATPIWITVGSVMVLAIISIVWIANRSSDSPASAGAEKNKKTVATGSVQSDKKSKVSKASSGSQHASRRPTSNDTKKKQVDKKSNSSGEPGGSQSAPNVGPTPPNVESPFLIAKVPVSKHAVKRVKFSPGKRYVATLDTNSDLLVTDLQAKKIVSRLRIPTSADDWNKIDFSLDNRRIIASSARAFLIQVWDIGNPKPIATFKRNREITGCGLSSDGSRAFTTGFDHTVIWDVATMKPLATFPDAYCHTMSADRKTALHGGAAGVAVAFNLSKAVEVRRYLQLPGHIYQLKLAPDATELTIGTSNGMVTLLDTKSGQPVRKLHDTERPIISIASGRDFIIASNDRHDVFVWDRVSGKQVRRTSEPKSLQPEPCAPNASLLTQWDSTKHTIRLIVPDSTSTAREFHLGNADLQATGYSEDSQFFAAASSDGLLRIWSLPGKYSQQKLPTLNIPVPGDSTNSSDNSESTSSAKSPLGKLAAESVLTYSFSKSGTHVKQGKTYTSDVSSGQHDGEVVNAVQRAGLAGSAFFFDGSKSHIIGPRIRSHLTDGRFSVSVWVHPLALRHRTCDIFSCDDWKSGGKGFVIRTGTHYKGKVGFNTASGRNWIEISTPKPLRAKRWSHIAATLEDQTMKLYLDGRQVARKTGVGSFIPSNYPIRLGGGTFDTNRRFTGGIDEVAVFARALTATEIRTLYAAGRRGESLENAE